MSVRFVIGRGGSGKTEWCFSRIVQALRADPLGPPIYWLLPRQATFMAERRLTCDSRLAGFCRARVVSFEQLGEEIFAECGGSATPQITPLGRQMILGHLLRRHAGELEFYKSIERQAGLAAELGATFDELERCGKSLEDLDFALDELSHTGPLDLEGASLAGKLHDVRLLYKHYADYLGAERLDQYRRLQQALAAVATCSSVQKAEFYVDGFFEFTDHERRMLAAIGKTAASMHVTLLLDPASAALSDPKAIPREMSLFHRTETTYRRLHAALAEEHAAVNEPLLLREIHRFQSPDLVKLERDFAAPGQTPSPGTPGEGRGEGLLPGEREGPQPIPLPEYRARGPEDFSAIERIEAPTRASEVDAVARQIKALLADGYRLREIAVLARNLEPFLPLISKSFGEHGIGFFADRRRSAAHHPLLQLLRSSLQIARSNWNHDAVMALIKTGLATLSADEADDVENYAILHRVRGAAWAAQTPWLWRHDLLRHTQEGESGAETPDPLRIDNLRRRVSDGLQPLVQLLDHDHPLPLRTIATAIFAMFDRLNVRATLAAWMDSPEMGATVAGRLERREEHEQVWIKLTELFDQMVDLLGDEPVTADDFTDIVESGLDRFDLAITPPTADQVLVGPVDRTRCPPVRAVFVLGMNEGEFPLTPKDGTVLTDRERRALEHRRLELEPDGKRRLLDEPFLAYSAFTQPSERLILSRSAAEDAGRPARASVFWNRVGELFPQSPVRLVQRPDSGAIEQIATPRQLISGLMRRLRSAAAAQPGERSEKEEAEGPAWRSLYQWVATRQSSDQEIDRLCALAWPALSYRNEPALSAGSQIGLFPPPLTLGVWQLETMAACPFKHFARYGLRLQSRQSAQVGTADLSQVYHRLLDTLVTQATGQEPGQRDALDAITSDVVAAAVMKVAKNLRGELMLSNARNVYLLKRVERTVLEFIAAQRAMLSRGGFQPLRGEVAYAPNAALPPLHVQTPRGNRVAVQGRIDRVDVNPANGHAMALDYRMRGDSLSLDRVYHGISLQLLTGMLALGEGGEAAFAKTLAPAAAFYVQLLRFFSDVKHPDDAPDPSDPDFLLRVKPRGVFLADALADLDARLTEGRSAVVAAFLKKDGSPGHRNSCDLTQADEFAALLAHVRRRLGELADEVVSGNIAAAPYQLLGQSPCPDCEFRAVCRFEPAINRYRKLTPMGRELALDTLRQEAADGK